MFESGTTNETVSVQAEPFDGTDYIEISTVTYEGENPEEFAASYEPVQNFDSSLSVPTYITKYDDTWFIVDCYHNRVIYNDTLGVPLNEWKIMSGYATQPHTLATDGTDYIIEDTENNRILIYEKYDGKFINTQTFYNVGVRPHFTVYDEVTNTFYVWSSMTGELYCFRHPADSSRIYLTDVRKIDELDGIYVRSFTIMNGDIYFVSGVSNGTYASEILCCDLQSLEVKKRYPVPSELAGMVQIMPIGNRFYVTISTDSTGSQDYATLVRAYSLDDLSQGEYEDIYSEYFIGGGTPYYISKVDDIYYLTEHRLQGHSIWSFKVGNGEISDVMAVY